jgi:single-strand DNA-binding protein
MADYTGKCGLRARLRTRASIARASGARTSIARAEVRTKEALVNSLNSILLEGNLTKDPESKTLSTGTQVCNFSLASDRFYRQNDNTEKEVSYFDVEAWAKLGLACSQNLKKGRGVRVVGRLKQDRWLDAEGKSKSRVIIVAEHVEFKPQKKEEPAEQAEAAEEAAEVAQVF